MFANSVYIGFVDLEKAYDNVLEVMCDILQKHGVVRMRISGGLLSLGWN